MNTSLLKQLSKEITQGEWIKSGFNVYHYKTDHFLFTTGDVVSALRSEKAANAEAAALTPQLIREVLELRDFITELANDDLDRISPGLKDKARSLLSRHETTN